jgi:MarR family transcriptional regulator, organic hydroperoxide resistance regulator
MGTSEVATVGVSAAELLALLTQAERLMSRRVAAVLAAEGHSIEGWRVISLLADGAGHPMTELAEQSFLPPASLTKLVDHLVESALVYRRVDPTDRRRIRAYLTPRGHQLHDRVQLAIQTSIDELPLPAALPDQLPELLTGLSRALAG